MGNTVCQSHGNGQDSPQLRLQNLSDRQIIKASKKTLPRLPSQEKVQSFAYYRTFLVAKMKIKRPIYFHENLYSRSEPLKEARLATKSNKSLYTFCYHFSADSEYILPTMGKYYTNLKNMRKAILIVRPLEDNENSDFERIGIWLRNFPFLVELDFYSFQCNNLGEKGIKGLFKGIKSLTRLFLFLVPIKDNQVKALANQLGRFCSLKNLELHLQSLRYNETGAEYLSKTFQLLDQLSTLALALDFLQSYQIKQIFSGLQSSKNLDTLKLCFSHVKFDDYQKDFPQDFPRLSQLKTLHFEILKSPQLNDEILADIASCLQRFSHLSSLSLSFRECKVISDKGFESICQVIKNMQELSFLRLDFSSCEKITNVGLLKLREALKNLKLTSLSLLFKYSRGINNKSMEIIASVLQRFPKLSALSLDFFKCDQIDDNGIMKLSQKIENLRYLSRLELNFSHNSKISGNGLRYLAKALSNTNLSHFSFIGLRFSSCVKVVKNQQAQTELENMLKAISLDYFLDTKLQVIRVEI